MVGQSKKCPQDLDLSRKNLTSLTHFPEPWCNVVYSKVSMISEILFNHPHQAVWQSLCSQRLSVGSIHPSSFILHPSSFLLDPPFLPQICAMQHSKHSWITCHHCLLFLPLFTVCSYLLRASRIVGRWPAFHHLLVPCSASTHSFYFPATPGAARLCRQVSTSFL